MKVLFLSQGYTVEDHPGWNWSLQRLQAKGHIESFENIPWRGYAATHGWPAFYQHVIDRAQDGAFDVVYFHYFHQPHSGVPSPENCMRELKSQPHAPTILSSAGDGFSTTWRPPHYPKSFRGACQCSDIVFTTQMGRAADLMVGWGARNVVLCPNSICPLRFKSYHTDPISQQFDFDVIMIGSRNGFSRNPFSRDIQMARIRTRIVEALSNRFGKRFGLFGHHWKGCVSAQGPCSFDTQQETFRRGRIIVGGNPYSDCDYYSSNRLFFEVASGIPTVELRVPHLDKIFRDGDQVYFADSVEDIVAKCEWLLKQDPVELYAKSSRAADEIAAMHTQYNRMKFKLDIARHYRKSGNLRNIDLPYFLPEVDVDSERTYATRMAD